MNIRLENTYIVEIVSKFYNKNYTEKDVEDGTITAEMVRLAILCEFEVIHRSDYEDSIKRVCK